MLTGSLTESNIVSAFFWSQSEEDTGLVDVENRLHRPNNASSMVCGVFTRRQIYGNRVFQPHVQPGERHTAAARFFLVTSSKLLRTRPLSHLHRQGHPACGCKQTEWIAMHVGYISFSETCLWDKTKREPSRTYISQTWNETVSYITCRMI